MKNTPNDILKNMIGSAQTSRKILEDSNIPIFPVILITPYRMALMTRPTLGSHYPTSVQSLKQSVYDRIFSAGVRQIHIDT